MKLRDPNQVILKNERLRELRNGSSGTIKHIYQALP
jgi:hypothetical protein